MLPLVAAIAVVPAEAVPVHIDYYTGCGERNESGVMLI